MSKLQSAIEAIKAAGKEHKAKIDDARANLGERGLDHANHVGDQHYKDVEALHGALTEFAGANPVGHAVQPLPAQVAITAGSPAGPAMVHRHEAPATAPAKAPKKDFAPGKSEAQGVGGRDGVVDKPAAKRK